MSRAKGSIVVDEIIVPITDIWLDKGVIHFEATLHGPVPAVDATDCVITDRSGGVVVLGHGMTGLRWDAIPAGSSVAVIIPLAVLDRTAAGIP